MSPLHKPAIFTIAMKKLLLLAIAFGTLCTAQARDARGDTLDIISYLLRLNITDFNTKILYGDATIGVKAKKNGVEHIALDLLKLTVDSVKYDGTIAPFSYNDSTLNVYFFNTLNNGDSATLRIFYHGKPLQENGDFGGFYWNATYAFNIGVSFLADPHTYGRVWFPCFDNFEERSYYEFWVTTKDNHKAFCNGLLLDVATNANTKIWHWKLGQDIPSYLASVAVSDYATLIDTVQGMMGTVPIELAARASDTTALKNLFVHLPEAFHEQEGHWGPYLWDRVGYCIVPFNAGAMEHATNIAFMQLYLNQLSSDCETTMAHELSHHWFGDLVTCEDASEMWLNEGWASYNENTFVEALYGEEAYKNYTRENHEYVLHKAHEDDETYLPVSGVPSEQTYGTTVYKKGADVIHTLRWYMGDSLFFNCVKGYLDFYKFQHVSTADLRDYLSQCSGINLNDYFNDWIYAQGFPHFSIQYFTSEQNGNVIDVNVYLRQRLSHAPHFYNNVPLTISYFDAAHNRIDERITMSGECMQYHASFNNFVPVYVVVDMDEQVQDAITDEWKWIDANGTYNFGTAKMSVQVTNAPDSALLHVEHNWIPADIMRNPIEGLHLHDYRYWTIDGIFPTGFSANATITYNGSAAENLDNTFFTNNEDSLTLMYRAVQDSDWVRADSFTVNKQGSATNKMGQITIYNIKKGEYSMAMWNHSLPLATSPREACEQTVGINEARAEKLFIYPNPANDRLTVQYSNVNYTEAEIYDLTGRVLIQQKIASLYGSVTLNVGDLAQGAYLVLLKDQQGNTGSKIFIKN